MKSETLKTLTFRGGPVPARRAKHGTILSKHKLADHLGTGLITPSPMA